MQGKTWVTYSRTRKSNKRKDERYINIEHRDEDGPVWIYATDAAQIFKISGNIQLNELTFFIETFQEILALRSK